MKMQDHPEFAKVQEQKFRKPRSKLQRLMFRAKVNKSKIRVHQDADDYENRRRIVRPNQKGGQE